MKRCGICRVLNGWEFNRGGFEREKRHSSSPLKTGMLDPTTSAKADLYCTVQNSIQNRSELQGKTQITDTKGGMGQGKARSQVKNGVRGGQGCQEGQRLEKGRDLSEVKGTKQAGSWCLNIPESNQMVSRTQLIKNGVLPHLFQCQPGQRKAIFPLLSVISLS